jgi:hypothetical protein
LQDGFIPILTPVIAGRDRRWTHEREAEDDDLEVISRGLVADFGAVLARPTENTAMEPAAVMASVCVVAARG